MPKTSGASAKRRSDQFAKPLEGTGYLPAYKLEVVDTDIYGSATPPPTHMGIFGPVKQWALAPDWTKVQPPIAPPVNEMLDVRLKDVFNIYRLKEQAYYTQDEQHRQWRKAQLTKPFDRLRWKLHLKLLDWGVII